MNRYYGSGGQRRRVYVPEPPRQCSGRPASASPPPHTSGPGAARNGQKQTPETDRTQQPPKRQPQKQQPPSPYSAHGNGLGGLLSKIGISEFEAEDWILLLVLYLMYRESRDEELLFMLGSMFLR